MKESGIREEGAMVLAGLSFFGNPFQNHGFWSEENEIGVLWQRLTALLGGGIEWIGRPLEEQRWFEVHLQHPDSAATGEFEVFVGVAIEDVTRVPVELVCKRLPPARYAVFTLQGEEIVSDWWTPVSAEWSERTGESIDESYQLQMYDARFRGMDKLAESEMEAWLPLLTS